MEAIPESNVCCRIGDYRIEIVQIMGSRVGTAKVSKTALPDQTGSDP